jgi:hypothetical protein
MSLQSFDYDVRSSIFIKGEVQLSLSRCQNYKGLTIKYLSAFPEIMPREQHLAVSKKFLDNGSPPTTKINSTY